MQFIRTEYDIQIRVRPDKWVSRGIPYTEKNRAVSVYGILVRSNPDVVYRLIRHDIHRDTTTIFTTEETS